MKKKELLQRKAVDFVLQRLLRYVDKDPQRNILRVLKIAGKLSGNTFPKKNLEAMQRTGPARATAIARAAGRRNTDTKTV